jgi:alpha-amylase
MRRVTLLPVWHHHQPVGNLEQVIEETVGRSYVPLLEALEGAPSIRATLHYSGPVLEWLRHRRPEFLARLKALAASGRVEILSGGFYEPVLTDSEIEDRTAQIVRLNSWLQAELGVSPKGVWLAEGVWDPVLIRTFRQLTLGYTILEPEFFLRGGVPPAQLSGYFNTEHRGETLAVFPNDPALARLWPGAPLDELFNHLRRMANRGEDLIFTVAQQVDRLGWVSCGGKGLPWGDYLAELFKRLSGAGDAVRTMTCGEALASYPARKLVYPPAGVPSQLGGWSLPNGMRHEFEETRHELAQRHDASRFLPFFDAGSWAGFRSRYSEANFMFKKQAQLRKLAVLRGMQEDAVRERLLAAQCNTAYWHGAYGGIYLPHLRHAVWRSLLEAEQILRVGQAGWFWERMDFDSDGLEEVVVTHAASTLGIQPHYGGSVYELGWLGRGWNLGATLTRRNEREEGGDGSKPSVVRQMEDWHQRRCFQDRFFAKKPTLDDLVLNRLTELGDFVNQPYQVQEIAGNSETGKLALVRDGGLYRQNVRQPVVIRKNYQWGPQPGAVTVSYEIRNTSTLPLDAMFVLEHNLSLSSGQKDEDVLVVEQKSHSLAGPVSSKRVQQAVLRSGQAGFEVVLSVSQACDLAVVPVKSLHHGAAAPEGLRQGYAVLLEWALDLKPGEAFVVQAGLTVRNLVNG